MSDVKFTIIIDNVNDIITFKDNNTDWLLVGGSPSKITIYMKGEDKSSYIVKKEITSIDSIVLFRTTGLQYSFIDLFGRTKPIDNFYLIEIIANEGLDNQLLSSKISAGFTYTIAERVYNATVGIHIPVSDLFESLTIGMMPQSLELLNVLSLNAVYSYDRENKWRKLYNHLNTVVNDLDY